MAMRLVGYASCVSMKLRVKVVCGFGSKRNMVSPKLIVAQSA